MNRLKHLRLADLELFITAAHLNNLGKAASLHNLSQSAASASIVRVENAFGRPLCTHAKRRFHLNQDGSILIPKVEEWLKQFHDTIAVDTLRPIRLATTHAIARVVAPRLLSIELMDLTLMRPDRAYAAILMNEIDIALVPDNAPWAEVISTEIGTGLFQLYSSLPDAPYSSVLLPENQLEVLSLMRRWDQEHTVSLAIKARIPSWSLIADICTVSKEVGFLPEFLAEGLHPVLWQPKPSRYRILALYRPVNDDFRLRLSNFIKNCENIFRG